MTDAFDGVKAVLFDVDGVLVDSKESNAEFYRALVRKAGYPEPALEVVHQQFHTPLRTSLRELLGIDEQEVERIVAMAYDTDIRQWHLLKFPTDVHGVLRDLANTYRIGAVSSRMRGGIDEVFGVMEIGDLFEIAVGYEDSKQHKPYPEPLLVALERLSLKPHEAVYIGDGHSDIDAAHAAGMRSIFLSPESHEHATTHIREFKELKEVLL